MTDLAKRAVACKHWRRMPGMLARHGALAEWLPDLTDPATIGCLLHLVREAYGNHRLAPSYHHGLSLWYISTVDINGQDTEVEALVAALEAADEET